MSIFVEGDKLNTALTELIANADDFLWLISPYIKLNDRTKFNLKELKTKPKTEIVIVFGKNEYEFSKSMSLEDLSFFNDFPNVRIMHVKNLHAKFYGSEDLGIITSMNLYEFSQVNNLEAGILIHPKNSLKKLTSLAISSAFDDSYEQATAYFSRVIDQATLIYHTKPLFKKAMLGFAEKYDTSETVVNDVENYYPTKKPMVEKPPVAIAEQVQNDTAPNTEAQKLDGFCIRSGVEIPFNTSRPFSIESYWQWAQLRDVDFPEKFCHKTGELSYGKTSMRQPILHV